MMNIETDGQRIERLAVDSGGSIDALLKNCGISRSRYNRLYAGQVLEREEVLRICAFLGIHEVLVTEQADPTTVESLKRMARLLHEMAIPRDRARALYDKYLPRIEQETSFRGAKVLDEPTILQMMVGEDFSGVSGDVDHASK